MCCQSGYIHTQKQRQIIVEMFNDKLLMPCHELSTNFPSRLQELSPSVHEFVTDLCAHHARVSLGFQPGRGIRFVCALCMMSYGKASTNCLEVIRFSPPWQRDELWLSTLIEIGYSTFLLANPTNSNSNSYSN